MGPANCDLVRGIGLSPPLVTSTAYLTLLAYTIELVVALARTALSASFSTLGLAPALYAIVAYPLVYLGAEWVFYYGVTPINMSNR